MFYEPAKRNHGLPYDPFKALTVRPIGWVTAMSAKGEINLSPYSFFNQISDRPPMVAFSASAGKDAQAFRLELIVEPLDFGPGVSVSETSAHG